MNLFAYTFYQDLNENKKKAFHFRGSFGPHYDKLLLKYELCSGPELRFKVKIKPYSSLSIQLGLIFFTAYLTIPFFSFKKWISEEKSTGFYFNNWAFVWEWMANEWEGHSSKDPFWKHTYFHIDDFFLGKREFTERELLSEQDVYFKLGGKEFKIDSIKWDERHYFRRFIPYSLYNKRHLGLSIDIKNPPMISGKGENSWDCGDDGIFGLSAPWTYERAGWQNRKQSTQLATEYYVNRVLKDAKRYGGSKSERGISPCAQFEYIGIKPKQAGAL